MDAEDEEMLWADVEDLEIFAGWLFIDDLDAGCSIFLEVDDCEETLMKCHLRGEVFLHGADDEELLSLRDFNDINVTDNEKAIEDVLISFDAF